MFIQVYKLQNEVEGRFKTINSSSQSSLKALQMLYALSDCAHATKHLSIVHDTFFVYIIFLTCVGPGEAWQTPKKSMP